MRWRNRTKSSGCRGFTLVEAALTTVIVGLGTVAMMGLLTSGTNSNQKAANLTTAVNLANNIHELCDRLPFSKAGAPPVWGIPSGSTLSQLIVNGTLNANADITWLDGQTFNASSTPAGPIDGTFSSISGMSGWSQAVSVKSANYTDITTNAATPSAATYGLTRITVTISDNGNEIYQTSWLAAY